VTTCNVVIAGEAPGAAASLAQGLAKIAQANVSLVSRESSEPLSLGAQLCCDFSSRDEWRTAFDECVKSPNERFAAIWASLPRGAQLFTPLVTHDEASWEALAETPLREFVAFLQGYFDATAGKKGVVLLLAPTHTLLGGPVGSAGWAAAADAQRSLLKVAARNWGLLGEGITLQTLLVTPDLLAGEAPANSDRFPTSARVRKGLPRPSLASAPTYSDIAKVAFEIAFDTLNRDDEVIGGWKGVTASTIGIDGGIWMAP
jgi:hypothetical protein